MANRLTEEQQHNQEEKTIKDLLGECVMKLRALRPGCAIFLDHRHNSNLRPCEQFIHKRIPMGDQPSDNIFHDGFGQPTPS